MRFLRLIAPAFMLLAGCAPAPAPQTAIPPPPPIGWITPLTNRLPRDLAAHPHSSNSIISVVSINVPVDHFRSWGSNNLTASLQTNLLPLANSDAAWLSVHHTNVLVRTNLPSIRLGQTTFPQLTNFIAALPGLGGTELVSSNNLLLAPGGEAVISRANHITIVFDQLSTATAPGGLVHITTNLAVVDSLAFNPRAQYPGTLWLDLSGLSEQFFGYTDPQPNRKPDPRFEIDAWASSIPISTGAVTVLATGPSSLVVHWSESSTLSRLPLLGRHFTRRGTQTNFFYRVHFLFFPEQ